MVNISLPNKWETSEEKDYLHQESAESGPVTSKILVNCLHIIGDIIVTQTFIAT